MIEALKITDRLRWETRGYHEALERKMMRVLTEITPGDYTILLCAFYGYYSSLEVVSVPLLRSAYPGLSIDERIKTPVLAQVLGALGIDHEQQASLPRCSVLPSTSTVEQALGAWYVLEGATLGGQLIARGLRRALPTLTDSSFQFFLPYGNGAGPRWRNFLQVLEEQCKTCSQADEMVLSAVATFHSMDTWLFAEDEAEQSARQRRG